MTRRCSRCNHLNEEGALFCANCSAFLEWSEEPASPQPREPADESDMAVDEPTPSAPQPQPQPQAQLQPQPQPPPVTRPAEVPPESAPRGDPSHALADLVSAIDASTDVARTRERPDLSARLSRARSAARTREVTVAVVGEFKRGKSTLINALIQTAACPVDADIVTAVPTLVRYGERLEVLAHVRGDGEETTTRGVAPQELAGLVSESADDQESRVQSVEIRVPHRILRSGLQLLDTPGVGGLESVHGQVSLASLHGVDGVLFVTDASQELTAPELEFLSSAVSRCATTAFVVTKTDLHLHWRRIVELDRAHLAAAGLDLPVLPVSSFLRLRAVRQPELNDESGFAALVEFLARDVVQGAHRRVAATVAHDVDFVTSQLAHEADAERVVLAEPRGSSAVVNRLDQAHKRAQALGAPDATWQQTLTDGVQDLAADIEHDLQARLREVLKGVREIIDQSDPRTSWPDVERWLRREVAAAGVANRDLLINRASELAEVVATQFDLDAGEAVELDLDHLTNALKERHLPSAASLTMPGGRLQSMMITARTTALVPMVAFSLVGAGVASLAVIVAPAVLLTLGIGGKLLRDEGKRQLGYRQNQAKAAAGKFVDEVAFEMNKETRDSLRRTQRRLRDEFQARAKSLQASATGALTAAQRAASLPPDRLALRTDQLEREAARLATIRTTLRTVSTAAEPALAGSGHG